MEISLDHDHIDNTCVSITSTNHQESVLAAWEATSDKDNSKVFMSTINEDTVGHIDKPIGNLSPGRISTPSVSVSRDGMIVVAWTQHNSGHEYIGVASGSSMNVLREHHLDIEAPFNEDLHGVMYPVVRARNGNDVMIAIYESKWLMPPLRLRFISMSPGKQTMEISDPIADIFEIGGFDISADGSSVFAWSTDTRDFRGNRVFIARKEKNKLDTMVVNVMYYMDAHVSNVVVAADSSGPVHVAWNRIAYESTILVSSDWSNTDFFAVPVVAAAEPTRKYGPALAAHRGAVYVAWCESDGTDDTPVFIPSSAGPKPRPSGRNRRGTPA